MMRKYLISIAIFSIVVIPQAVFAETFLTRSAGSKNTDEPTAEVNSTEATQKKNRLDRIESSLKALDRNISIIEGNITQIKIRISGIDPNNKDIALVNDTLVKAEAKLSETREMISKSRQYTMTLDPKDPIQVKQIREMIASSSKLLHESIVLTQATVKKLKLIKLISSTENRVDNSIKKSKKIN